jgi:hypothetical protein
LVSDTIPAGRVTFDPRKLPADARKKLKRL